LISAITACLALTWQGRKADILRRNTSTRFHFIQRMNGNITIHAGEAFGKESIWQAIQWCGAHRIGHATRLVEDIMISGNEVAKLGTLAQYVLDKRIPSRFA